MKQVRRVIAVVTILCVALVNAGAVQAVHLQQCCGSNDAGATDNPDEKGQSNGSHYPGKCYFCVQFASLKTTSVGFTGYIALAGDAIEEPFSFETAFFPGVRLSSQSPRSPPSYPLT